MKILHAVESYLPARNGMSEVVRQLSEGLTRRGHEVTVATSAIPERSFESQEGVTIKSFPISGNAVRGIIGPSDDYIRFVQEGAFDIITCFAAQQWATDLLLPHLSTLGAKKVFVPTGFSALNDLRYAEYFIDMPEWLRGFDANIFLSDTYQDMNFARRHGIQNTILIPNGASYEEFATDSASYLRKKLGISTSSTLILHVGSYTGEKGHREAIEIFLKAKIRHATFLFIGQNPARILKAFGRKLRYIKLPLSFILANKRVLVCTLNREDTVQAFKEADLFLFPSRIECSPVVLFEAAASGTPFLSSDVGNAREICEWTGGGAIIPTKFVNSRGQPDINVGSQMLTDLVKNKYLLEKMASSAKKSWQQHFTWDIIISRYEELYYALLRNIPVGEL
jgi:L-malate glycosyltransferase